MAIHTLPDDEFAAIGPSPDSVVAAGPGVAAPALAPAIVHGRIVHRRRAPATNAFAYAGFCLSLPLSRLDEIEAAGIGHNRAAWVAFHDRDHGACDGTALEPWIRRLLADEGIEAGGEIVLHAFPRMLGYVFNPVSFWVCHDRRGAVRAVLCEVSNTFGERHNYLVADPTGAPLRSGVPLRARKVFHVSPFCAIRGGYRFRFHFGADRWLARIDYFDDDDAPHPLLETWISGRRLPLQRGSARRLWLRYPLFTAGVVGRIHWQALRLWLKRVPFFTKPAPPTEITTR
jgi:DUF1365 family protein